MRRGTRRASIAAASAAQSAAKNSLRIKERNPDAQVYVLYNRDIRTYGFQESLYTRAREAGVVFVRYQEGSQPQVSRNGRLRIMVHDELLGQPLALDPDLLVLSQAVVPADGSRELAELSNSPARWKAFSWKPTSSSSRWISQPRASI